MDSGLKIILDYRIKHQLPETNPKETLDIIGNTVIEMLIANGIYARTLHEVLNRLNSDSSPLSTELKNLIVETLHRS